MSKLLSYEIIVKAHEGDPDAVNAVLQHYTGYIRYCSRIYGYYNKDMKDAITSRLIESLLKFKVSVPYKIIYRDSPNRQTTIDRTIKFSTCHDYSTWI